VSLQPAAAPSPTGQANGGRPADGRPTDGLTAGGGLAGGSLADGQAGRNRVVAVAEIVADAGPGGVTRLPVLASRAPLVLRRTPSAVYLVGGAAGPLGGDQLTLRITVGAGASLRLRTAAAAIALPGLDGLESELRVNARVAAGGRLEYLPEPVVVSAGARHATVVSVDLAAGATLLLRDEVLLGRHGEAGGTARSVLRVSYAGRPLLHQSVAVSGSDEASLGPAGLAGYRAVGMLLRAGEPVAAIAPDTAPGVAVMPLAGPGVLVTALADDAVTLRRRLTAPTAPGTGPGAAWVRVPG
jgi:urease accessory protein